MQTLIINYNSYHWENSAEDESPSFLLQILMHRLADTWLKHSHKSPCETCCEDGNTQEFSAEQLRGKSLELLVAANPAPLVSEVINEFLAFYQGWKVIKRNNQVAFTLIPVSEKFKHPQKPSDVFTWVQVKHCKVCGSHPLLFDLEYDIIKLFASLP